MSTTIKLSGNALKVHGKGAVAKATARAIKKASRDSARDMTSEAVKRVRESKRIKVSRIKKKVKIRRNRARAIAGMVWGVDVKGGNTPLISYPVRKSIRGKGVSVEINRGRRVIIKGAFIETVRGVRGVFKRDGKPRLPIKALVGTRVIDVLKNEKNVRAITARGLGAFQKTFERVLPGELKKI